MTRTTILVPLSERAIWRRLGYRCRRDDRGRVYTVPGGQRVEGRAVLMDLVLKVVR